jgi:hypothetical protein
VLPGIFVLLGGLRAMRLPALLHFRASRFHFLGPILHFLTLFRRQQCKDLTLNLRIRKREIAFRLAQLHRKRPQVRSARKHIVVQCPARRLALFDERLHLGGMTLVNGFHLLALRIGEIARIDSESHRATHRPAKPSWTSRSAPSWTAESSLSRRTLALILCRDCQRRRKRDDPGGDDQRSDETSNDFSQRLFLHESSGV